MSVGCTLLHRQAKDGSKYDLRAQYTSGWLCASQNRLTFIHHPDDDGGAYDVGDDDDQLEHAMAARGSAEGLGCGGGGLGCGGAKGGERIGRQAGVPGAAAARGSVGGGDR